CERLRAHGSWASGVRLTAQAASCPAARARCRTGRAVRTWWCSSSSRHSSMRRSPNFGAWFAIHATRGRAHGAARSMRRRHQTDADDGPPTDGQPSLAERLAAALVASFAAIVMLLIYVIIAVAFGVQGAPFVVPVRAVFS